MRLSAEAREEMKCAAEECVALGTRLANLAKLLRERGRPADILLAEVLIYGTKAMISVATNLERIAWGSEHGGN